MMSNRSGAMAMQPSSAGRMGTVSHPSSRDPLRMKRLAEVTKIKPHQSGKVYVG